MRLYILAMCILCGYELVMGLLQKVKTDEAWAGIGINLTFLVWGCVCLL
jgi:hypothetical protein